MVRVVQAAIVPAGMPEPETSAEQQKLASLCVFFNTCIGFVWVVAMPGSYRNGTLRGAG